MASHGIPVIQDDFAPAAWDMSEDSLPEISVGSHVPTRYRSTMTNILSKHCTEVKLLSEDSISTTSHISKKKLKELIAKHNNELFSFMVHADTSNGVMDRAELIFQRYERENPTHRASKSPLPDLNVDRTIDRAYQELDEGVKKLKGEGSLEDIQQQIRWLLNQYRTIGEEVLRLETILFQKMDMLDKLNHRLPLLTTLNESPALPALIDAFSNYAKTVYETSQFEECYVTLVELYKKWSICRQMLTVHHMMRQDAPDPQCSICLLEPVACAMVPCGHTFCGLCTKKQNTSCYICRGQIRERIRLYFT